MSSITTLETVDVTALAGVSGGRGQSRAQISERYKMECLTPDAATARKQFDWMAARMIPDKQHPTAQSLKTPGFMRRVVKSTADLCHWPMPDAR